MHDLVEKLVSGLEKGKPSPISPYLFHLYDKFECLREGEASMLASAKVMFQFEITSEAEGQPDTKDGDSNRKSLNSEE